MGAIDRYVAELNGVLRGDRRAKAELLAEMRDGLVDATEAYQGCGLGRQAAEQRAVSDFGAVSEVADECQKELALAQGRRTALLTCAVLAVQSIVWGSALQQVTSGWARGSGLAYVVVEAAMKWLGLAAFIGSLLAALACGVGVRYLGARRGFARAAGLLALAVSGFVALAGTVLAALSPRVVPVMALLWLTVFLAVPITWVAASARRCLRVA